MSYVESVGCLMSSLMGVLGRVCWVSYVESDGCLMHAAHSSMNNPTAHTYNTTAGTILTQMTNMVSLGIKTSIKQIKQRTLTLFKCKDEPQWFGQILNEIIYLSTVQ